MTRHRPKRLPLWPSGANQWINCPGSVRAKKITLGQPRTQTKEAKNGTIGHAIVAGRLNKTDPREFLREDEQDYDLTLPDDEIAAIDNSVREIQFFVAMDDFEMLIEQTLNLDFGRHEMHCKIDVLLVNDTQCVVIDYKHGAGQKVYLDGNKQLMLYTLAARKLYPDREYCSGILQPRGVGEGLDLYRYTTEELDAAEITFKAAVERAYSPAPLEYCPGPWCQWCPGLQGLCPELLKQLIELRCGILDEEDVPAETEPPWWLLDCLTQLQRFLKGVDTRAYEVLREGGTVPGWKLEESSGRSRWHEPDEVSAALSKLTGRYKDEFEHTTTKPMTITDAKREVKKLDKEKKAQFATLIFRPPSFKRVRSEGDDVVGFEPIEE